MEIKINKEIRNYTEAIYFGLSMRQFVFSVLACIMAVLIYFMLKDFVNMEIVSWACIIGAIPFILMGFFTYNGMTADQVFLAWLRSEIINPRELTFKPTNFYYELVNNNQKDEEVKNK